MPKELLISTRGIEMPESPIRKLAPLAYAAQDRGVKIYRLNIGHRQAVDRVVFNAKALSLGLIGLFAL